MRRLVGLELLLLLVLVAAAAVAAAVAAVPAAVRFRAAPDRAVLDALDVGGAQGCSILSSACSSALEATMPSFVRSFIGDSFMQRLMRFASF